MSSPAAQLSRVEVASAEEDRAAIPALSALRVEAAADGAEVSFLAPLEPAKAETFWRDTAAAVARGERILLLARDEAGIAGTAQAVPVLSETAPRMAGIAKLIVAGRARGRGLGRALLAAAEAASAAARRPILFLYTEEGSTAYRLYLRSGWTLLGVIPDATLRGDGTPSGSAMFWKHVGP